MKSFIIKIFIILFSGCLLSACDSNEQPADKTSMSMKFLGELIEASDIITRAPASSSLKRVDFLDSPNFYIQMNTDDNAIVRTYRIPEEQNGILKKYNIVDKDTLNWESQDGNHTFYSWSMPWVPEEDNDPYLDENSTNYMVDDTRISFEEDDDMYKDISDNFNCKILETFIGAKTGPVTYRSNGEYVPLRFQHLVSRIYIDRIRFTYMKDGEAITEDIMDGTMTFIGLPSEGIFTRINVPSEKGSVAEAEARPIVKGNKNEKMEVTYTIGPGKYLYVCPNIDFSKVKFRINTPSTADVPDLNAGDFIGDFSSIIFARDEDDWWDEAHPGQTTLYAGEEMKLTMNLRRGSGTSISASISGWGTQAVREGSSYPRRGIYDISDMNSFYNTFMNSTGYTPENEERMYELYGSEDKDGNPEYKLYTDINFGHGRLPMGQRYPLNGMGHTVTFSSTNNDGGGEKGHGTCYVGVPRCYDIYLADNEGHMAYIDEDYCVWVLHEDGTWEKTAYVMEPLTGNNVKYYVDLISGKVSQTTSP